MMTRLVRTRRKANTGALEDDDVVGMTAGVEAETAFEVAVDGVEFEAETSEEAAPPRETIAEAACAEADADIVAAWVTVKAGGKGAVAEADAGVVMMVLSPPVIDEGCSSST
jgi:hypothetical protein